MSQHAPEALLAAVSARQGQIMGGALAALVAASLAVVAAVTQVNGAAAEVATIRSAALRVDAGREFAHPAFAPPREPGVLVKLGTFVSNPPDASKIRYVRAAIQLATVDVAVMESLGANKLRASASVTRLLGSRSIEELGAPGGQDAMREAIRVAILREFPEGAVLGVHFTEFVVQ